MAALRAEIVERVERRPLFVMAEERNVPYFRLFFMTKPELLDAILEVEHVPPHDVMPSQEALDRVREIAAEAYRRHEEIAAEEAMTLEGSGVSLSRCNAGIGELSARSVSSVRDRPDTDVTSRRHRCGHHHGPPPGPFATLLFSRTELTAADNCTADNTNVARLDTNVAPYLYSLGMSATGNIVTGKTALVNAGCVHYNSTKSASWSQAANLGSQYGWSFVSHTATYPTGDLSKLSPTQAFNETCGSADAIDAHGLRGAHGMIAYPGEDTGILALQQKYGTQCFAWGRRSMATTV